jgi:DNA repair exonuclease SbcCD ATPase subunit
MSEVDTVQVEEKKAFISRPYSNAERIKKDEEELEEMLRQQKGEVSEEEEEQEAEPTTAEERSFKKRYGDLRRHTQKQQEDLQSQISELKEQLTSATKKEMKLPKTDDEIDEWMSKYPDVAGIVETIAIKKAREQSTELEERVTKINKMQEDAERQKAETVLLQLHPDFDEIRQDDDFHTWAEEQPRWIQQALYDNDNDAQAAARAIDLYKADRGISTKKKSKRSSNAAEMVDTRATRNRPTAEDTSGVIKESDVQKMSATQYEKNQDTIMEAIRSGKFVYDLSGSAR